MKRKWIFWTLIVIVWIVAMFVSGAITVDVRFD